MESGFVKLKIGKSFEKIEKLEATQKIEKLAKIEKNSPSKNLAKQLTREQLQQQ